mmetsp:Transcript_22191/g.45323  ORF Transcript_22191/g.45323 Transcript_22191/m.45323 type:complete len:202 (+) Transcript_22191:739-1344(+)
MHLRQHAAITTRRLRERVPLRARLLRIAHTVPTAAERQRVPRDEERPRERPRRVGLAGTSGDGWSASSWLGLKYQHAVTNETAKKRSVKARHADHRMARAVRPRPAWDAVGSTKAHSPASISHWPVPTRRTTPVQSTAMSTRKTKRMPRAAATSDGWAESTCVASWISAAVRSSLRRMHQIQRSMRRPTAAQTAAVGALPA